MRCVDNMEKICQAATAAVAEALRWRHVCYVQEAQQGPFNSTSGHLYVENLDLKRDMHPIVHSSTVSIAQTWKQTKCPLTDEQIKKCVVYKQWNVIPPLKKSCHLQKHRWS